MEETIIPRIVTQTVNDNFWGLTTLGHITNLTDSMFVKVLMVIDYFYLLRTDLMQVRTLNTPKTTCTLFFFFNEYVI